MCHNKYDVLKNLYYTVGAKYKPFLILSHNKNTFRVITQVIFQEVQYYSLHSRILHLPFLSQHFFLHRPFLLILNVHLLFPFGYTYIDDFVILLSLLLISIF